MSAVPIPDPDLERNKKIQLLDGRITFAPLTRLPAACSVHAVR